jgi:hypothetical protein
MNLIFWQKQVFYIPMEHCSQASEAETTTLDTLSHIPALAGQSCRMAYGWQSMRQFIFCCMRELPAIHPGYILLSCISSHCTLFS